MRRVALLALVAALAAAALPSLARASSRAACAAPRPGTARCYARVVTAAGLRPALAAAPNVVPPGYGPTQFHRAYSLPKLTPLRAGMKTARKRQTIAIVDAYDDPKVFADLTRFDATFRLPVFPRCTRKVTSTCFQVMNQSGGTALPASGVPSGWAVETSLDVQVAHEICENCKILLVEARSAGFADLGAAVDTAVTEGANVVSNSYGSYRSGSAAGGPTAAAYDHRGHAIVVAAGDSGFGRSYPADLNTVVAVGGTSLQLTSGNAYVGESVWNSGPSTGTGSGCDDAAPARSWQLALTTWSGTGCGGLRAMNDLSADADPATGAAVYDSADGYGWIQVGGTSLAAPLVAGVYGLAANSGTASYPASLAYGHAASLHDVVSGDDLPGLGNLACALAAQCTAGVGYDLPTGLGTPDGLGAF
jgi:subtilase family serine protease